MYGLIADIEPYSKKLILMKENCLLFHIVIEKRFVSSCRPDVGHELILTAIGLLHTLIER
jgi:hypothetical protein